MQHLDGAVGELRRRLLDAPSGQRSDRPLSRFRFQVQDAPGRPGPTDPMLGSKDQLRRSFRLRAQADALHRSGGDPPHRPRRASLGELTAPHWAESQLGSLPGHRVSHWTMNTQETSKIQVACGHLCRTLLCARNYAPETKLKTVCRPSDRSIADITNSGVSGVLRGHLGIFLRYLPLRKNRERKLDCPPLATYFHNCCTMVPEAKGSTMVLSRYRRGLILVAFLAIGIALLCLLIPHAQSGDSAHWLAILPILFACVISLLSLLTKSAYEYSGRALDAPALPTLFQRPPPS